MTECNGKFLADIFNITQRRVQQLAAEGVVIKIGWNAYDLWESVKGYIRFLKDLEKTEQNKLVGANRRIKDIALQQLEGGLVEKDMVKKEAFDTGRKVRDAMLNIPDRLSPLLTTVKSERKIRKMLTTEIKNALIEVNPYVKR